MHSQSKATAMITRAGLLILAAAALGAGKTNDDVNALVKAGDLRAAFDLSLERAEAGDPEGDQALGWFYDNGKHVIEDKAKAVQHFRKCADAGLKHCQWRLGVMLDMGEGATADPQEAFRLFAASAAQDYPNALASLGVMYANGRGTLPDFAKSMESYRTAAKLGNAHGFFGVGMLHAMGQGVPKDYQRAFAWFLVAHFQGDKQAKAVMDELSEDFSDDEFGEAVKIANEINKELGLSDEPDKGSDKPT